MFKTRDIVCAVELGTSKICVLIGEVGADLYPTIIGHSIIPSANAIVKGEITDMKRAGELLAQALEKADRASGGELENCRLATVVATGCAIDSLQGSGIVTVRNPDRIVTEIERAEANESARTVDIASDREILNTCESYFLVDKRRVNNPIGQSCHRLEAVIHVVHAKRSGLENFRRIFSEYGWEDVRVEPVFSPLADAFGVLRDHERENGSLLVNIGAGTTEYLVNSDNGVCASGMLQVGMEHVANDLAIGFNMHIDRARELLRGILERASAAHQEFLEIPAQGGRKRRIPIAGCERIVEARLREIFEIIRHKLIEKKAPRTLSAGGIITGGGAEYYRTKDIFSDVFDLSCRIAGPADIGGAATDLETPRFSTVWGALKSAAFFLQSLAPEQQGVLKRLFKKFNRALDRNN